MFGVSFVSFSKKIKNQTTKPPLLYKITNSTSCLKEPCSKISKVFFFFFLMDTVNPLFPLASLCLDGLHRKHINVSNG